MGCITSKVTRTSSKRDRRNHRGFHGASVTTWEELLASHSGKDKLFSFVATKMTNSSFTMLSGDHRPRQQTDEDDDDDPNPIPEAEVPVESAHDATESTFMRFTRSKSCQEPRKSDDVQVLNNENDGINGHKIDWRDKNLAGSISFHTVEEYDALLERIRRFSTRKIDYDPWDDVEVPQWNPSAENQDDRSIQVVTEKYIQKESGDEDEKGNGSVTYYNYNDIEKIVEVDGHGETGWKRKSMAKGLKSLDVSTAEFSGIGRFKQRHNVHVEGHIYSPGTYVTPKFGSYNSKLTPGQKEKEKKQGEENSAFSPELVAAFEDCMQQLQEEEDSILTHMDEEYTQVDDVLD